MRKIFVVAKRDYMATVATRGFILSIVFVPVLIGLSIAVQKFISDRSETGEKKIAVIDATGELIPALIEEAKEHNERDLYDPKTGKQTEPTYTIEAVPASAITDEVRVQLSDRIRKNDLFAFTEIPADLLTAPPGVYREVPFHSQKVTMGPHRRWFERTLNRVTQAQRLRRAGIDPAVVAASRIAVRADGKTLFEMAPDGTIKKAESSERELAMFIPMGIMSLMYLAIMMSQYMLQSTMEEKQQRIAEVLLGSLSPFQLMAGKLLANVGVSLTVVAVYMIGGTFTASHYSVTQHVPFGILGWFFVYQVLAVLLFGSIFASVGAAASDLKDAQGYMMPVMITLILPMMIWFAVLDEPNSPLAVVLSLIPTMTPLLMTLRLAMNTAIPLWQPLCGVLGMLATTYVCVFAAGRIFRIGILSAGKTPKLRELLGWAMSG